MRLILKILVQDAQRVENEVAKTKAEAEKVLIAARAEKEANELRTQALTPAVLQKMWIEKWDGKLPVTMAGGDSKLLLNLPK